MSQPVDRSFLVSVFLLEAWDAVVVLEEVPERLADGRPLDPARLVAHRLKGSAGLNGFPRVSALGAALEELIEALAGGDGARQATAAAALGSLVACLKQALDAIGTTGREPAGITAVLAGQQPALAPSEPAARRLAALEAELAAAGPALEYFGPEAVEHLDATAASLLALEREGWSEAEVGRLFRAVHTLKGAAYTVGLTTMGELAHRAEDVLDAVRERRLPLTPAVLEAGLAVCDALRLILRQAEEPRPELPRALERAGRLLDTLPVPAPEPAAGLPAAAVVAGPLPPAVEAAVAVPASLPAVEPRPAPGTPAGAPPGRPPRREGGATIRVALARLDALMNLAGELVVARGRLERRLARLEGTAEALLLAHERLARLLGEFETRPAGRRSPRSEPTAITALFGELEFDRYDHDSLLARSLGELVNDLTEIHGELVALGRGAREDTGQVQRLGAELRAEVTRARMIPIGRLFARLERPVRDMARAAGKEVVLEVTGGAVELDSAVIEQIADPLLHLAGNAIVHGLEAPDERRARGKPAAGRLVLAAAQRGGAIHVEVADDGRGIDVERIRRWARDRGLGGPDRLDQPGPRDLVDLIFLPGFTTAERVTRAAGRGVGMDVVRTNVSRLGGDVEVETHPGAGTRFTLRLPLTIAIADAFLVRAGGERLAVPVAAVRRVLRLGPDDVETEGGSAVVAFEDERVSVLDLGDLLLGRPGGPAPGPRPALAVRAGRRTLVLAVDELLGKDEIVVKGLGFLEGVGPWAGATVGGEGGVVLLLDPARLPELAPAGRPQAEADGAELPGRGRGRVLLVDDSISIRKFVGQMLERAGFEVLTARDGAEALQRLDATVDVLVTDLEMPRVNGYELVRDVRRRPATRELPIVVLTTRAGDKHAGLARRLGVDHYVTKPVDEQAFVGLMAGLVAPAAAAEAVGR